MAANPDDLFTQTQNAQQQVAAQQQAVKAPTSVYPDLSSQQASNASMQELFNQLQSQAERERAAIPQPTGATAAAPQPTSTSGSSSQPTGTTLYAGGSSTFNEMAGAQPVASPPAAQPASQAVTPGQSVSTGGVTTSGPFTQADRTFTPFISTVDKSTETVQGQLKDLFDEGNPLMVQARNRAEAMAAGRGLQNSSLAMGAAQLAQMNAALPIAQQDAATYAQRAMLNAQTINEYRMAEMSYYQELGKLKEQGNINAYLTTLQAGFDQDLAHIQGSYSLQVENLRGANELLSIAARGDVESRLQLEKYGFDSNLSAQENLQRLEQIAAQGDANAKLQLQQFQLDTLLKEQEQGYNLQLEDKRFQNNQNLVLVEYAQRGVLSEQEAAQAMERLNQQHLQTLEQIRVQAEANADVAAQDRSAQLQGQYLAAVAARQAAASAEITQIYTTPKLSATQQNTAVRNAYARLDSDLAALSAYYASSPLWEPGGEATPPGTTPTPGTGASTTPNTQTPAPTSGSPLYEDIQVPTPQGSGDRFYWAHNQP